MKINFLRIGFYATMFAMFFFVTACGSNEESHDGHDHQGHEQHDHDHDHEGHQHEQGEEHDHDHEGHQHEQGQQESSIDKTGKEYTSAYICPMHCEGSGSDKAGTCPACKMDYVANKDI